MPKKHIFIRTAILIAQMWLAYIATLLDKSIRKGSLGHYYLVYCKYKTAGGIF